MSRRIKELAREGAYDGVVFHRVIDGFMAQTGDVKFGKSGGKDFNPGARRHGRLRQAGPEGRVLQHEPRPRHLLDGAFAEPELGQLAVLHLLRRRRAS